MVLWFFYHIQNTGYGNTPRGKIKSSYSVSPYSRLQERRRLTPVIPVSCGRKQRELLFVKLLPLHSLSPQTYNEVRTVILILQRRQPKGREARARAGVASSKGPCEAEAVGPPTEAQEGVQGSHRREVQLGLSTYGRECGLLTPPPLVFSSRRRLVSHLP